MASAAIASRNESSWGESLDGFMGKKLIYTNPSPANPNPNRKQPKLPKKKQFQSVNVRHAQEAQVVTQTASDDAYSFNQRTNETNGHKGDGFNQVGSVNINISAYSRSEVNELRKKLESDLDRIRKLNDLIDSGQFPGRSNHFKTKKVSGHKRPLPVGPYGPKMEHISENGFGNGIVSETLMKSCRQILTKLMKHKHSWVFNKPVDAVALGLHDYHQIVKRPMDLGTVKSNFGRNFYSSPAEFAADVRLIFNNAILYNPKTDEVHLMAIQLLSHFENLYRPVQDKLQSNIPKEENGFVNDGLQGSSWNKVPPQARPKKHKTIPMASIQKKLEPIVEPVQMQNQTHSSASNPLNSNQPGVKSPVPSPSPPRAQPVKPVEPVKVAPTGKLPKPRAKDPDKREMTMEEKHKLGVGLQNLPQEKMPQLVQIIRKRNEKMVHDGDEIELDIEVIDTETLWELDRFVTNWKKLVSKTKRQALMGNYSAAPMGTTETDTDEAPVSDRNDDGPKKIKKGDGEEDVDIGDEMPESSFPPVEIEKDDGGLGIQNGNKHGNDNASSSSSSSGSSSSDSSSSSGSDSGSSSDSDADEAQS